MKKCFKCNETKPLAGFYKHKAMPDGHVNKCKECNKKDVTKNRVKNIAYYRQYDRSRGARQAPEYLREFREKYPQKYKAHNLVNNALRDGRMRKMPCEVCGSEIAIHGHHDDYSFPLNVRWLCAAHHSEWHNAHGEGANG